MIRNTSKTRKNPVLNGPFNDLISAHMKRHNLDTLEDFANVANVGRSTVYDLVRGRLTPQGNWVKPSIDVLVKLAQTLEMPAHELLYRLEPEAYGSNAFNTVEGYYVTVAGYVGAGPGQLEPCDTTTISVTPSFVSGKDLVAYIIRGDSMDGGKSPIKDGATVIVNSLDKGTSGQAVVALLEDGSMVCKLLKNDKFGYQLLSANPFYTNSTPPRILQNEIAEIIGRVVRIVQDIDNLEA
jgi:repressor LexA